MNLVLTTIMIEKIEKIIRKRWLFVFVTNVLVFLFTFLFYAYLQFKHSGIEFETGDHFVSYFLLWTMTLSWFLFFQWISFYFNYVRKGFKILILQMLLISTFGTFSLINGFFLKEYHWGILFLSCIQILAFLYCSFDLLRINLMHKFESNGKHEKAGKIARRLKKRFKRYA